MPDARVIEVKFIQDGRKAQHRICAGIPALFHVNQESRTEILPHYPRAFKNSKCQNGVYFNFASDTIYFWFCFMPHQIREFILFTESDIVKVKKAAMSVRVFSGRYANPRNLATDFVFRF